MRVSILQPTYWARTHVWNRIYQSDCFIWLDSVKFSRSSTKWEDRTVIEGRDGRAVVLRLPMRGSAGQLWKDVGINEGWQRHLKTITQCYARAPYATQVGELLNLVYGSGATTIEEVCWRTFSSVYDCLGASCRIVRSSDLNAASAKGELVLDLVKEVGGDTYISGQPGMTYLPLDKFERSGITVVPQLWKAPATAHGLRNPSILHLLAHEKLEFACELLQSAKESNL